MVFPANLSPLLIPIEKIEIAKNYGTTEWHEDVKSCLMQAGVGDKSVVFLFNDTQVSSIVFQSKSSSCRDHHGNDICSKPEAHVAANRR